MPTITLSEMHCLGQQIDGFCSARRLSRRIVCRTTQLSTVIRLVDRGLGLSLVPQMAADHHRSRQHVTLPLKTAPPTRDIALAWRHDRTRSVVVERLAALLRERLKGKK